MRSPSLPEYGREPAPAPDPSAPVDRRSLERVIAHAGEAVPTRCLARREVLAYLGSACPRDVRARVDAHVAECGACRRWLRHIDDEVLEYVGGEPSDEELARMDAHLDACGACRELVHRVLQGRDPSSPASERELPDSGTTFSTGNIVNGRYRILSFVGRGGMGEVYEAHDQLMDRRIALKTVLCTVADRPRAARRFKEEVRNAQRVGHPNVCRINDLQEHHEGVFGPPLPFFTMEFIEGERLGERLMRSALPLDHVRVVALQLLDGLRAAHARGVLHLDFKSDNVMLRRSDDGTPDAVIMDFGLSRVLGHESRLRTTDRRQFAGTLPYMSVEQLECRDELGPASDVYAFGVVLYEMLTRTLPFDGDSLGAVLLKQLKERPAPPSRAAPGLSPALDRFVLKCLSSKAHARYADAGQALAALRSIEAWSRAPLPTRFRKAVPLAAVGLLGAVVAIASVRRTAPAPAPAASSTASHGIERVTHELAPAPPSPGAASPIAASAKPPASAGEPALEATSPAPPAPVSASAPLSAPAWRSAPSPRATPALPSTPSGRGASVAQRDATAARPPIAPAGGAAGAVPGATSAEPLPRPAPLGAAPTDPARRESAAAGVAPARVEPAEPVTNAGGGDDGWRPARVPKRLSVPGPSHRAAVDQKRP